MRVISFLPKFRLKKQISFDVDAELRVETAKDGLGKIVQILDIFNVRLDKAASELYISIDEDDEVEEITRSDRYSE